MSDILDINLAPLGEQKIAWVKRHMPILRGIEAEFKRTRPFSGLIIALSVHLEAKTAYLCRVLEAGGAKMAVTGSNPLSTVDDVAAALVSGGMDVYARYGAGEEEYNSHLRAVLATGPNVIIDDGGELVALMHSEFRELLPNVIGGCEETTTGINRLFKMDKAGELLFPMMLVNNADCKHLFDNRYGTGQSVWDGIVRTTNLIIAGKRVVVSGYGWCGKGVSMRAQGLGARVIITETDPVRALEAFMDGFEVMTMSEAAEQGDIFVTVTGCRDIITCEHMMRLKDGAILSNAGHFNLEIDIEGLKAMAVRTYEARHNIGAYELPNGRTIFVIAEGRLVNLAAAEGHPAEIMDMSFAIQALSAEYLVKNKSRLSERLIRVPKEIDEAVAMRKLESLNIKIDKMTDTQREYLGIDEKAHMGRGEE